MLTLPPLDVSPTSGSPGTVITVHGEECVPPMGLQFVVLQLVDDTAGEVVIESNNDGLEAWSLALTVPTSVDPDHAFAVVAQCGFFGPEDDPILIGRYDPVCFDVIGEPSTDPTVPPTQCPPPAPPAAPPPAPPTPARPATPVVAEPTFTG